MSEVDPQASFVGRADPLRRLKSWLMGEHQIAPLAIASMSGPGGIGKTFLLDHVLRDPEVGGRGYLVLRLQGSDRPRTLAQALAFDLITSHKDGDGDAFKELARCRAQLEAMDAQARAEIEKKVQSDPELPKQIADAFGFGVGLLEWVPIPKAELAAKLAKRFGQKHVEEVVRLVQSALAYQLEDEPRVPLWPGASDTALRNRLRTKLFETLGEAFVADLSDLLVESWSVSRKKLKGRQRLLIVLDDYERLQPFLEGFLIQDLVPRLQNADFSTTLLVIGRDRVADTHPAWKQNYGRFLLGDIRLTEMNAAEAEEYVRTRGVTDPAAIARIVRDTSGYPYLLHSEVDAELEGGGSALALKTFFDRTTRWMSDEQRGWSLRLAFLDEISIDTIPKVLPDDDPERVLAWFKNEASLRSSSATTWAMLPIIRSRLRAHLRNDSPRLHAELSAKAVG
jgi:hypothetical protein